jgi:hypothetical protein
MTTTSIEVTFVKSTKGTHVYGSDVTDAPLPSVYIKRAALPETPPKVIVVTLSWD